MPDRVARKPRRLSGFPKPRRSFPVIDRGRFRSSCPALHRAVASSARAGSRGRSVAHTSTIDLQTRARCFPASARPAVQTTREYSDRVDERLWGRSVWRAAYLQPAQQTKPAFVRAPRSSIRECLADATTFSRLPRDDTRAAQKRVSTPFVFAE